MHLISQLIEVFSAWLYQLYIPIKYPLKSHSKSLEKLKARAGAHIIKLGFPSHGLLVVVGQTFPKAVDSYFWKIEAENWASHSRWFKFVCLIRNYVRLPFLMSCFGVSVPSGTLIWRAGKSVADDFPPWWFPSEPCLTAGSPFSYPLVI